MPPKQKVDEDEDIDSGDSNNKDLTLSEVPIYGDGGTDGGTEEQEESIKDILLAIKTEFRTMGRKVESFEGKLGETQGKVDELAGQLNSAEE